MVKRRKHVAAAFFALLAILGCSQAVLDRQSLSPNESVQAPVFEVDPMWPKPLPNHWLLGMTIGVHVDEQDNVWIGGNGEKDAHLLKFTKEGKFLLQMGKLGADKGSNDPENFGRVAKIWVDPKTNEAYVADGYKNKRVAVLDADTGKMKRYWGAYGNKPDDADLGKYDPAAPLPKQFRNPVHCVERSNDGLIYVCDRQADRIQVFKPDGSFVKEARFAPQTLGSGSAWDVAFSKDPQQKYIYLADGTNEVVRVILRDSLQEITNFGDGGRQPGQFYGVHSIATDSKGNIYTTETYEGKRLQKFVFKGVQQVAAGDQGTPWPGAR